MFDNPSPPAPSTPEPQLEYAPPSNRKISALAIISLCLGVVATPLDYACEAGLAFGLAAIITGIIAMRRTRRRNQRGRVMAILGIILGGIALLVGITCGAMIAYSLRNEH